MKHSRVLGVYAHPDDADVGAGGSLAQFASRGAEVRIVLVTAGDAGGFQAEGQDQISSVRRLEQQAAANALGINDVVFLEGYQDGHVPVNMDLERDIVEQIRDFQPTLVMTTSPEHNWESLAASHPDHRAVGEATVRAIYPAARNPFAYPELLQRGLEPWTVKEVWFQGRHTNNFFQPLTESDLQRKIAAVSAHASQFEDMDRIRSHVRAMAKSGGEMAGMEDGGLAEAFFTYRAG